MVMGLKSIQYEQVLVKVRLISTQERIESVRRPIPEDESVQSHNSRDRQEDPVQPQKTNDIYISYISRRYQNIIFSVSIVCDVIIVSWLLYQINIRPHVR